ncbi:hypothetical protein ACQJBY_017677 [Aegilops geniculata]
MSLEVCMGTCYNIFTLGPVHEFSTHTTSPLYQANGHRAHARGVDVLHERRKAVDATVLPPYSRAASCHQAMAMHNDHDPCCALNTINRIQTQGQASGKQYHKEWPRWKPPASGIIKLNVDAGFSPNNNEGATGVIVRDHSGALLRGQAIWYGQTAIALIMEALAVRDGVDSPVILVYQRLFLSLMPRRLSSYGGTEAKIVL